MRPVAAHILTKQVIKGHFGTSLTPHLGGIFTAPNAAIDLVGACSGPFHWPFWKSTDVDAFRTTADLPANVKGTFACHGYEDY